MVDSSLHLFLIMYQFEFVLILAIASIAFCTGGSRFSECTVGQFKLPGMDKCHDLLKCSDINDIKFGERIGLGSTKVVFVGSWKGHNVAVSKLLDKNLTADFNHGLEMLQKFNPNQYVVQLVGFCEMSHVTITEYHQLGNATAILSVINKRFGNENIAVRLKFCLNYARILELLHDGPGGTRVMCDSNDLEKLLSQMLITDDLKLIINDLDALPLVDKNSGLKVKCGERQILGEFVAPEQKWPYSGPFRAAAMPGYDEKTDIWKAGDVFKYLISDVDMSHDWVHYRLFNLIKNCKLPDPNLRPTAGYIVSVLEKILAELSLMKTEL